MAATEKPHETRIVDARFMFLSALAAKAQERSTFAKERHMPSTQRGKAIRSVGASVFLVANANSGLGEQAHNHRQHLCFRQPLQCQITSQDPTQVRKSFAKTHQLGEFPGVARLAPPRMVAILLSPASVATGCLQMASRIRTDPNARVSRRNRETADTIQHFSIAYATLPAIEIEEALARSPSRDPRHVVSHIYQAGGGCDIADIFKRRRRRRFNTHDSIHLAAEQTASVFFRLYIVQRRNDP